MAEAMSDQERSVRAQAGLCCGQIYVYERLAMVWEWACRCGEGGMATKRTDVLRAALAHAEAEDDNA